VSKSTIISQEAQPSELHLFGAVANIGRDARVWKDFARRFEHQVSTEAARRRRSQSAADALGRGTLLQSSKRTKTTAPNALFRTLGR
jgi:hypothetical protein